MIVDYGRLVSEDELGGLLVSVGSAQEADCIFTSTLLALPVELRVSVGGKLVPLHACIRQGFTRLLFLVEDAEELVIGYKVARIEFIRSVECDDMQQKASDVGVVFLIHLNAVAGSELKRLGFKIAKEALNMDEESSTIPGIWGFEEFTQKVQAKLDEGFKSNLKEMIKERIGKRDRSPVPSETGNGSLRDGKNEETETKTKTKPDQNETEKKKKRKKTKVATPTETLAVFLEKPPLPFKLDKHSYKAIVGRLREGAEKYGIKEGMRIVKCNDQHLESRDMFRKQIVLPTFFPAKIIFET